MKITKQNLRNLVTEQLEDDEPRMHHGTSVLGKRMIQLEDDLLEEAETLRYSGDTLRGEVLKKVARHVDAAIAMMDEYNML